MVDSYLSKSTVCTQTVITKIAFVCGRQKLIGYEILTLVAGKKEQKPKEIVKHGKQYWERNINRTLQLK